MLKFRTNREAKLVEKILNNSDADENEWRDIFELCDMIKSGEIQAKPVVMSIGSHLDPQKYFQANKAINLLEVLMKNCGSSFHSEVKESSFQEILIYFIEKNENEVLNEKLFELIQNWACAFQKNPKYFNMVKTYDYFKRQGIKFPPVVESEVMFSVDCAPEWVDGTECIRCKDPFGALKRKHHCRNCGKIFCDDCSKFRSVIPNYGIHKEVRVCQICFEKIKNPKIEKETREDGKVIIASKEKTDLDKVDEENLQLALAISASEALSSKKNDNGLKNETIKTTDPEDDPELSRYLDRHFWEEKNSKLNPTAPPYSNKIDEHCKDEKLPNHHLKYEMTENIEFSENAELFSSINQALNSINFRLKNSKSRGRSIEKDSHIQASFNFLWSLTSQLSSHKMKLEAKRANLELLQDKVDDIKDAREAIELIRKQNEMKRIQEQQMMAEMRRLKLKETMDNLRQEKIKMIQNQINNQTYDSNQIKNIQNPAMNIDGYNKNFGQNLTGNSTFNSSGNFIVSPYVLPTIPVSQFNPYNSFQNQNDRFDQALEPENHDKFEEERQDVQKENSPKDLNNVCTDNENIILNNLPSVPSQNIKKSNDEDSALTDQDGVLISF